MRYHTGYYFGGKATAQELSEKFIEENHLKLVTSNYSGSCWDIDWVYSDHWSGLEFIIVADSFEIAQNILFCVHCCNAVVDGTLTLSVEPHYPHEFGTLGKVKGFDRVTKPLKGYSSYSLPAYFYLAALASKDKKLENAITKYQLSTEVYSQEYMDLQEVINWKTTNYSFIQMRFAYAIILAYSVVEELGFEVNVKVSKQDPPSSRYNGGWDPEVHDDLTRRLERSNIDIKEHIIWMIRGEDTKIEKRRPIAISRIAEWADTSEYDGEFHVKDAYVYLLDAIQHISFLRSSISSHAVGDRIMELSVFDVANAQLLARRLILEKVKMWK